MKKHFFLNIAISFFCSILFAQNKQMRDSTIVLPGDIYSNFSKENYSRTKSVPFFITIDKNDSIKILSFDYNGVISACDKFYKKKDFKNAANCYVHAFNDNNGLGKVDDRLKAACCFSMIGNKDSAFIQLYRIASKGNYMNIDELNSIEYLKSLHKDKRWEEIIGLINKNRNELINKMNSEIKENPPTNNRQ